MRRSRIVDLVLLTCAVALGVALMLPGRPPRLPPVARASGDAAPRRILSNVPREKTPGSTVAAVSLFVAPPVVRAAAAPAGPATPLEKPAWLHFVAFAAISGQPTTYFFRNDLTGRILMLAKGESRSGWTLLATENGAYVLENDARTYLVTEKPQ